MTISACWSAALAATEQRRLLGLPTAADGSTPAKTRSSRDGGFAPESLAAELNRRLGCAVLAMRYPVDDQFALALSGKLYALLAGEGQPLPEAVRTTLHELVPGPDDAGPGSNAFPPLSLAAPALFGSSAIGLRLAAPDRDSTGGDNSVEPTCSDSRRTGTVRGARSGHGPGQCSAGNRERGARGPAVRDARRRQDGLRTGAGLWSRTSYSFAGLFGTRHLTRARTCQAR